jgi:site-specific DNA-methyltransferase (adenine-specific)
MSYKIIHGDNIDTLKQYPDNHFDSIVTDPPYGIEFLGKDWDNNTGAVETWEQCFRVLKPGGHLLAFSAARTYHNLATNIEGAGFDIRDQLMWLYASGFPKAQDIGKAIQRRQGVKETKPVEDNGRKRMAVKLAETNGTADPGFSGMDTIPTSPEAINWQGWKTALKPAHEPIVMARKPFKGSTIDNVLKHGTGALNIDATRIEYDGSKLGNPNTAEGVRQQKGEFGNGMMPSQPAEWNEQGRFPSNVLGEVEGYQKFFYCPKVSRAERHCGFEQLDHIATKDATNGGNYMSTTTHPTDPKLQKGSLDHIPAPFGDVKGCYVDGERFAVKHQEYQQTGTLGRMKDKMHQTQVGNNHPTVKPVELMKYLVRLVTPENGKVLDPFNGSGSTGMACAELGYEYVGCELDQAYVDIATKRIEGWIKHIQAQKTAHLADNNYNELFE